MPEEKKVIELTDDDLEKVTGGVLDMEDMESDMETDRVCDGSNSPTRYVRDRQPPNPIPRKPPR